MRQILVCAHNLQDLIASLMTVDPKKRPSATEVRCHMCEALNNSLLSLHFQQSFNSLSVFDFHKCLI